MEVAPTFSLVGTVYRKLCQGIRGQLENTFFNSVGLSMPSLSRSYFSNTCVRNCWPLYESSDEQPAGILMLQKMS